MRHRTAGAINDTTAAAAFGALQLSSSHATKEPPNEGVQELTTMSCKASQNVTEDHLRAQAPLTVVSPTWVSHVDTVATPGTGPTLNVNLHRAWSSLLVLVRSVKEPYQKSWEFSVITAGHVSTPLSMRNMGMRKTQLH